MSYKIICASSNTAEELKIKADYICDESDARPVLQEAIDRAIALGVPCVLLPGTYEINSAGTHSQKGAICFYNPAPASFLYKGHISYAVLEGAKIPFGFREGAIVTLGKDFYNSLPDDEEFSVFYSAGNDPYSHGMILKSIGVKLPSNNKAVIAFDGRYSAGLRYVDCWAAAVDLDTYNHATSEGISVPNPRTVGFRSCHGSNNYCVEMKNLATIGFGVGFDVGGEHIYCESLSAYHGIYGFRFDCYKGKRSIDEPEDVRPFGVGIYPVVCVNLLDEHNVHMPRFGNASHNGETRDGWRKSISITGMNLQWPNTCPGHTDRTASDYLEGRSRSVEDQIGSWCGKIEYVIDHSLVGHGVNICDEPFFEQGHGIRVETTNYFNTHA
jgi:hypothetical protein